jgi:hypothetical protein
VVPWAGLFPFITPETTKLVAALLEGVDEEIAAFPHSAEERVMTPLLEEIVAESRGFFQLHLAL